MSSSNKLSTAAKVGIAAAAAAAVGAAAWYLLTDNEDDEEYAPDTPSPSHVSKAAPETTATAKGSASGSGGGAPAAAATAAAARATESSMPAGSGSIMSRSDCIAIFTEMHDKVQELQLKLKDIAEAGDHVEMQQQQELGIQKIEKDLHAKFGVMPDDLARAAEAYKEDSEVIAASQRLQALFAPDMAAVPEGMTADVFFEKFSIQVDLTKKLFEDAYVTIKNQGITGEAAFTSYMQYVLPKLQEVQNESLKLAGMSEQEFGACLMKFQQSDPRFMKVLHELQMVQEERKAMLLRSN